MKCSFFGCGFKDSNPVEGSIPLYATKTTTEASSRRKWLPIVIVDDASLDVVSSDRFISIVSGFWNGELLIYTLMRPMTIIVTDILFRSTMKMVLSDDQNVIETFFTHWTYPVFRKKIFFWWLIRGANNIYTHQRWTYDQTGMRIWYRDRGSDSDGSGFSVHPAKWIRLVPSSMKKSMKMVWRQMVVICAPFLVFGRIILLLAMKKAAWLWSGTSLAIWLCQQRNIIAT